MGDRIGIEDSRSQAVLFRERRLGLELARRGAGGILQSRDGFRLALQRKWWRFPFLAGPARLQDDEGGTAISADLLVQRVEIDIELHCGICKVTLLVNRVHNFYLLRVLSRSGARSCNFPGVRG